MNRQFEFNLNTLDVLNRIIRARFLTHLGLLRRNGASFLAIISRNFRTSPGFGYNSISLAKIKCVMAASRAMFLPTFTGYSSFFCVLYKTVDDMLKNGGFKVQL